MNLSDVFWNALGKRQIIFQIYPSAPISTKLDNLCDRLQQPKTNG